MFTSEDLVKIVKEYNKIIRAINSGLIILTKSLDANIKAKFHI